MSRDLTSLEAASLQAPALAYRPDIDGLRAVAVLAVMGYHAFPRLVPAGYLGVDVFFVISGFLITRLILDALNAGTFSLADFYARRARRLFPALAIVLACVLLAGWWILLPHEYEALGRNAAAGSAFVANIASWYSAGYFDVHADRKPLLHLWSLGVEEQFYLIWPVLLAAVWHARRSPAVAIAALGLGSLALWLLLAARSPDAAFYFTSSRLWQICAGALFAVPAVAVRLPRITRGAAEAAVAGGLALIAGSVMFAGADAPALGIRALAPIAGAMICIAAAPSSRIGRLGLAWKPLVGIGLISYPLYLWHWPLLSFLRLIEVGEPAWHVRLASLGVATLLAWATYRWIERPIRARRWRKARAVTLAALLGAAGAAGVAIAASGGVPSRLAGSDYLQIERGFSVVLPGTTSCDADASDLTQCRFSGVPRVALVGDSHAEALFYGFLNSGHPAYAQVVLMTRAGCQPALAGDTDACVSHMQHVLRELRARDSLDLVVITGNSDFASRPDAGDLQPFIDGYAELIEALRGAGKRVVLAADVPHLPFEPDDCVRSRAFPRTFEDPLCTAYPPPARPEYDTFLARLSARVEGLEVFHPRPVFCDAGGCHAFVDGVAQYKDGNHLSHQGSKRVAAALIAHLASFGET